MLGQALEYAVHYPRRVVEALARDPVDLWDKLHDQVVQQWEYRNPVHRHEPSPHWDRELQRWLNMGESDSVIAEFDTLWPEVAESVRAKGVDVGPESFAGFNDGDPALLRAIWRIVRQLRPLQVVETGVGHGFTARFILEALGRNGQGHLSSIDRPPFDPETRARVGIAVPDRLRPNWTLIAGSSRRRLPGCLSRLGAIDLFIHDSLHTKRNVRFEVDRAWVALRPGGMMVIDDIDSNGGFESFCAAFSGFRALVCEAEPVRPDERRFNKKGLFAIIVKAGRQACAGERACLESAPVR